MLNEFVLNGVVTACSGLGELRAAQQAHCLVFKSGHLFDLFLGSGIVNMYSHMGDLESAFAAFEDLENPGLASWAAIIKAYPSEGHVERAMDFFRKLHGTGLIPSMLYHPFSLVALLLVWLRLGCKSTP
ncbi:hypothetical protein HPP92_000058 [Vanilla planifolia]|uniref:Pentatricopeptide repeat-containing protein n=1 Tax=Vanilla planifolia TaxID=51239 RepID=A0A835RX93_VANPL|nr:hypothetical protein HPP92_000058 [Vanilla planifolia]